LPFCFSCSYGGYDAIGQQGNKDFASNYSATNAVAAAAAAAAAKAGGSSSGTPKGNLLLPTHLFASIILQFSIPAL
jgi:hypothetical protein